MQKQFCFTLALLLLCIFLFVCGETPAESGTSAATTEVTTEESFEKALAENAKVYAPFTMRDYYAACGADFPEQTVLWDADGAYTGVRFSYADGQTYTWECPVKTEFPIFVTFLNGGNGGLPALDEVYDGGVFNGYAVIEYSADGMEWLFDRVDLTARRILYRHENTDGHFYTFGTCGSEHESGTLDGNKLNVGDGDFYCVFDRNQLLPIRTVLPLTAADTPPDTPSYRWAFITVPTEWQYDADSGVFYEVDPPCADAQYVLYRADGLDTLYYSETPIDSLNEDTAFLLFFSEEDYLPRSMATSTEEKGLAASFSPPRLQAKDGHSRIWRYTSEQVYFGSGSDPVRDLVEMKLSEQILADLVKLGGFYYREIYIVQLDEHYFAKISVYLQSTDPSMCNFITRPMRNNILYLD